MKLQDETIKEIEQLPPSALFRVYDLILSLKRKNKPPQKEAAFAPYLRARVILDKCKGSMSDDIINARKDRL
jgi:hypothetical protein